jgi:hypothetical protein
MRLLVVLTLQTAPQVQSVASFTVLIASQLQIRADPALMAGSGQIAPTQRASHQEGEVIVDSLPLQLQS